jgi:protein required for attachment to host cells
VSQLLLEGARDKAYDGLIIIAAEPILADLKDALAPEARALVIGKIIRDYASLEPPASREPPEMRH